MSPWKIKGSGTTIIFLLSLTDMNSENVAGGGVACGKMIGGGMV